MLFWFEKVKFGTFILVISLFYTFSSYFFTEAHKNSFVTLSIVDGNDPQGNESYETEFFNFTNYDNISYDTDFLNTTEFEPTEELKNSLNWQYSKNYFSFITPDEDICTCDLHLKMCDINCCCDLDCTEEDMKVFSKCDSNTIHRDANHCHSTDFLLRNNIPLKDKENRNGLLCILHDNLQRHLRYKDLPYVRSHKDLQLLLEFQSKFIYSWEVASNVLEKREIKAGSPLHILRKEAVTESPWSLPAPCFSRMCTCNRQILYLQDSISSCAHSTDNLWTECENNIALSGESYTNFCITLVGDVSNAIIHTKNKDYNDNDYLSKICVSIGDFEKPVFSSNMCYNAVKDVHYLISHNGTFGIVSIVPKVKFVDIVNDLTHTPFVQTFKVEFKWHNATDTIKKSGNPGYQIGLPILTGTNISNNEHFSLQTENLSVVTRDSNSLCSNERRSIKFGKNFKTSCRLKTELKKCKDLQDKIFDVLLNKDHYFVGVFGNANKSNSDEWIEAYHVKYDFPSDTKECHLITSLKIKIAYSAVGTVMHPQFKILGLGYYHEKSEITDRFCNQYDCNIVLSTSVSFYDVTDSPVSHHPKIPSLKANLPEDFFYPFLQES